MGESFSPAENVAYIVFTAEAGTAAGYTKNYRTGRYRVAVPAAETVNTGDAYISHIASTGNWETHIGLLNTGGQEKSVTISFNTGQEETLTLQSGEFRRFTIAELFNDTPQPEIRSAVLENAAGIVGTEIFLDEGNNIMAKTPSPASNFWVLTLRMRLNTIIVEPP